MLNTIIRSLTRETNKTIVKNKQGRERDDYLRDGIAAGRLLGSGTEAREETTTHWLLDRERDCCANE